MLSKRKFDIFLFFIFLLFSVWLMNKSFGYDGTQHEFRIARHQIGDFGLHLSLIRSFSSGDNSPVQSPFFPGSPLPYHYYFDLLVGLLERIGVRIDMAFNGLSALFFTTLLYVIYKLPQVIFIKKKLLGILSVILFVFHSNLTFIDFFKDKGLSFSAIYELWRLPDYIHKGPFDGSLISIFFTMNVYLNQRHLVAALAIGLIIFFILIPLVLKPQKASYKTLIILGLILGIVSRLHMLIFFSASISILVMFIMFKRFRFIILFFAPLFTIFYFHLKDILRQDLSHPLFNVGFLSEKPLSFSHFFSFWFANLGIALVLVPLAFFIANRKQKVIFLSVFSLFLIGNIFQLGFRIDHNHTLFNFFIIFANFYIANLLVALFKKGTLKRLLFVALVFFLTVSGLIDMMVVKNDFQYTFFDSPSNSFMLWIKNNTQNNAIFLSRQEILDPVTLSGRRNYLGHTYYLSVMGYNYSERQNNVKSYYEASSLDVINKMRRENISYIVVPAKPIVDFNYIVDVSYFDKHLEKVYKDEDVIVYKL